MTRLPGIVSAAAADEIKLVYIYHVLGAAFYNFHITTWQEEMHG